MGDNMHMIVETMHAEGDCTLENALELGPEQLKQRDVIKIDISERCPKEYDLKTDPTLYKSKKTDRGPLRPEWQATAKPIMTCYKLCSVKFKWFGIQKRVESIIAKDQMRMIWLFHQKLFCLLDEWFGLTIDDIRKLEQEAKEELDERLKNAQIEGKE